MSESRRIVVPSKWVLAGEHSVLRGCPAIIYPNFDRSLELINEADTGSAGLPLLVEPREHQDLIRELLELLERLVTAQGIEFPKPPGIYRFSSSIPSGAGLGSSAALSVAIVKSVFRDSLTLEQLRTLARGLEDRFHGQSSGMDIAAVTAQGPVLYKKGEAPRPIEVRGNFRFSFHDTGLRASTRDCIAQVLNHPRLAECDQKMVQASAAALHGLQTGDATLIRASFEGSLAVYREWGLVPESVESQIRELLQKGAQAVRVTGAGGGGFLVALN